MCNADDTQTSGTEEKDTAENTSLEEKEEENCIPTNSHRLKVDNVSSEQNKEGDGKPLPQTFTKADMKPSSTNSSNYQMSNHFPHIESSIDSSMPTFPPRRLVVAPSPSSTLATPSVGEEMRIHSNSVSVHSQGISTPTHSVSTVSAPPTPHNSTTPEIASSALHHLSAHPSVKSTTAPVVVRRHINNNRFNPDMEPSVEREGSPWQGGKVSWLVMNMADKTGCEVSVWEGGKA